MKTKLIMSILTLAVSASSFASDCRVLSEPDSKVMHSWAAAHRKDAVEHAAAKHDITLVATGERRTHVPSTLEYDFAIVNRQIETSYTSRFGNKMVKVEKYFDITDNKGVVQESILTITQRVRATPVRFEPTGNFEGSAIEKAMSIISGLCNE